MAELYLQNVSKRFGAVDAVRQLDLSIGDGEVVTLVGPSGCGKTTTLRIIAGLEQPTDGSVLIGGQCVNDYAPKDRNVSMVFQDDALQPHLNVRNNLGFGLKLRREPRSLIKKRVDEAAEKFGLAAWMDRLPHELSGGQRQRVAMARSLIREPSVLLFDEPLSNLDAPTRAELRAELSRRRGDFSCPVLHVTHDQAEAMLLGDRIAVMNHGRIEQIGPPQEVYQSPSTRFVAEFIGSPSMNILHADLSAGQGNAVSLMGTTLKLSDDVLGKAKEAGGLAVGIRPEDIALLPGTDRAPSMVAANAVAKCEVLCSRYLGPDWIVECEAHNASVIYRGALANSLPVGAGVWLEFPSSQLHLFRLDNGKRL